MIREVAVATLFSEDEVRVSKDMDNDVRLQFVTEDGTDTRTVWLSKQQAKQLRKALKEATQ